MPKKIKKTVTKSSSTKANGKAEKSKSPVKHSHGHFLGLLILFAGFSLYAITSFFNSTNDFIDNAYVAVVIPDEVDVPAQCNTCPEPVGKTAVCQPLWDEGFCPEGGAGTLANEGSGSVAEKTSFSDVPAYHPNAEAIEALYGEGVVGGYDDGTFKPNSTINRAELLKVITTATDADLTKLANNLRCFIDVNTEWFAAFVCFAKAEGWVKGYADGSFKPGNPVTRSESLKMIMEAFEFFESDFLVYEDCNEWPGKDSDFDPWSTPYFCHAAKEGILPEENYYLPKTNATRGWVIQVIYDLMKYQEYNFEGISAEEDSEDDDSE